MTYKQLKYLVLVIAICLTVGCGEASSSSITGSVAIGDISGNTISLPSGSSSYIEPSLPVSGTAGISSTQFSSNAPAGVVSSGTEAISTSDWNLILVNKTHKLSSDYKPELADISNGQLDKRIVGAMKEMLEAAKKDGVPLYIVSSYRTPERQTEKYNKRVNELVATGLSKAEAEAEAGKYIAPPGTSEHCTGLAADIVSPDWYTTHSSLTEDFDQTKQFKWLSANARRFGFILRYPKGKEDITMIGYEPWHYRYVGVEAATEISKKGLTLEEYLGQN